MAGKEYEQPVVEQRYTEVKKELALLREAIQKKEKEAYHPDTSKDDKKSAAQEIFALRKDVTKKETLLAQIKNSDSDDTSEQNIPAFDDSPGDHTVIKL